MAVIGREQAVAALIEAFPSIETDITDETWKGLVYLEVSCFARYTQLQIDAGNVEELKRCYEIARTFVLDGDEDIQNAVGVSYLEHLNFADGKVARSWGLAEMPAILRQNYTSVHGEKSAT